MTKRDSQILTERVRMEYREMPGLSLTLPQAGRLLNVDHDSCRELLESLVAQNYLAETHVGTFILR